MIPAHLAGDWQAVLNLPRWPGRLTPERVSTRLRSAPCCAERRDGIREEWGASRKPLQLLGPPK